MQRQRRKDLEDDVVCQLSAHYVVGDEIGSGQYATVVSAECVLTPRGIIHDYASDSDSTENSSQNRTPRRHSVGDESPRPFIRSASYEATEHDGEWRQYDEDQQEEKKKDAIDAEKDDDDDAQRDCASLADLMRECRGMSTPPRSEDDAMLRRSLDEQQQFVFDNVNGEPGDLLVAIGDSESGSPYSLPTVRSSDDEEEDDIDEDDNDDDFDDGDEKRGMVKKVSLSGRKLAIKMFKADDPSTMFIELDALQSLRHKRIVRLRNVVFDAPSSKWGLVFDLARGGDMLQFVLREERLSERRAARLIFHVASALAFAHERGWCHRDVKLESM
jgi:serine/threonine protein kinase